MVFCQFENTYFGITSILVSVTFTSGFPDGTGVPVLYDFNCVGTHSRVQDCTYTPQLTIMNLVLVATTVEIYQ